MGRCGETVDRPAHVGCGVGQGSDRTAPGGGEPSPHTSVLTAEMCDLVRDCARERARPLWMVDGTIGAGGHARALLETAPQGSRLLGLDLDPAALDLTRAALASLPGSPTHRLVRSDFRHLAEIARRESMVPADFVLFDTGVSSMQLDRPERGFSFRANGPLDMRYGPDVARTAADLLDSLSERALADILYRYGEERAARRIARRIVAGRPWHGTGELAEAIAETVGRPRGGRIHAATRSFQAIRAAVNDEQPSLQHGLAGAASILGPGGYLVVIAFESLTDRLVKNFFRSTGRRCICPPGTPQCQCRFDPIFETVRRQPVRPGADELARNPRCHSARMRFARRTAAPWRPEAVKWVAGNG